MIVDYNLFTKYATSYLESVKSSYFSLLIYICSFRIAQDLNSQVSWGIQPEALIHFYKSFVSIQRMLHSQCLRIGETIKMRHLTVDLKILKIISAFHKKKKKLTYQPEIFWIKGLRKPIVWHFTCVTKEQIIRLLRKFFDIFFLISGVTSSNQIE